MTAHLVVPTLAGAPPQNQPLEGFWVASCESRVSCNCFGLKLNTANPEVVGSKRESGKFSGAWHHAAVARGGAAVARMPPRVAA